MPVQQHAELVILVQTSERWSKAIVKSGISVVIEGMGQTTKIMFFLIKAFCYFQVKPSSNQVNLASCCVMPPDLTAFAKQFDIQLLTHNDPKGKACLNKLTENFRSAQTLHDNRRLLNAFIQYRIRNNLSLNSKFRYI